MTNKIFIGFYNHTHMFVTSNNDGVEFELRDRFSFYVEGYRWMPAFKSGRWDGKIRLYNPVTKLVYVGLLGEIQQFAKDRGYDVDLDPKVFTRDKHTRSSVQASIDDLGLSLTPREYQFDTVVKALNEKRMTIVSPTGSGKSLIIYLLAKILNLKTLVIVPTKNLVHQMAGDFKDYGYTENVHLIYGGKDKDFDEQIGCTTWQSIYKMPRTWFDQFDCVIVDEVHGAKAKSLTAILEKMSNVSYRFGTTGTMDGVDTNRLVIEGLLGPVHKVTTTDKLIKDKVLADFNVECILMKWPDSVCKTVSKYTYQEEIDFVVSSEKRNKIIMNLVLKQKGNNLVLVNFVEKHGEVLHEMFKEATDRPVYYIHGGIPAETRNEYRAMIEKESDCIVLATTKSFATGTNVKKLDNIFFCHPSKSRITTLQAIGRVLRRSETKTKATLYDIVDDLSYGKKHCFSMKHFIERMKFYANEQFPYEIKKYGYKD